MKSLANLLRNLSVDRAYTIFCDSLLYPKSTQLQSDPAIISITQTTLDFENIQTTLTESTGTLSGFHMEDVVTVISMLKDVQDRLLFHLYDSIKIYSNGLLLLDIIISHSSDQVTDRHVYIDISDLKRSLNKYIEARNMRLKFKQGALLTLVGVISAIGFIKSNTG
jgi:hypothetical protein